MTLVIYILFTLAFLALVGLVISTILRTSRNPVATHESSTLEDDRKEV